MERRKAEHDDIPAEIDFSKGTRGKFVKPGTTLKLPVQFDSNVEACLMARAPASGVEVDQVVGQLQEKRIKLVAAERQ